MDSAISPPQIEGIPAAVRGEPPPRHGGPLAIVRFMARNGMLNHRYARLLLRLGWLKLRWRGRLQTDGMAFVGPGVKLEIGRNARIDPGVIERDFGGSMRVASGETVYAASAAS